MHETHTGSSPQSSESESVICNESLVPQTRKNQNSERCIVCIRSFRCGQPVDPDNLAGKYFIDALRYAGIIPNDRQEDIIYQITQTRVKTRKEERTEIEVESGVA